MISKALIDDLRISRPLIKEDLIPIGEGFNFVAYEIENQEILLVAKDDEAADKIPIISQVLKHLQSHVNLKIPQVLAYSQKTLQHHGYYLVTKIQGQPLTYEVFEDCSPEQQANFLQQLVRFLQDIHHFPLNTAKEFGLIQESLYPEYPYLIERIKQFLFPTLSDDEKTLIQKIVFDAYDTRPPDDFIGLVHGDMSPEHILYSPKSLQLTGVIDFADIQLTDPDFDLMYLYQDYGRDFMMQFYPYYSQGDTEKLHTKIQFFNLLDQLEYIAEGILENDKEQEQVGFDSLRYQLEQELHSDDFDFS